MWLLDGQGLTTYLDIRIEEEAEPVGEKLLCNRLCPSKEKFGATPSG